ncbi:hypothetical protein ADUPG1_008496 [Aduncisulcus paluster]|uniref:Uncharacterized protein n=1 Tax=Aduncisulcus paluster TaxID=2918883 RepID=A0ABQ5KS76_9EUKA|nr:hypothetical protein ADUPG1_008496 [Aduncisulcus paluster]
MPPGYEFDFDNDELDSSSSDSILGMIRDTKSTMSPGVVNLKGNVDIAHLEKQIPKYDSYDNLREYQQNGVQWMWNLFTGNYSERNDKIRGVFRDEITFIPSKVDKLDYRGGILADDMGLGKTIQVSYFLRAAFKTKGAKNCLIICPKSIMGNWQKELLIWCPEAHSHLFHQESFKGSGGLQSLLDLAKTERNTVLLTTYATMYRHVLPEKPGTADLTSIDWDIIVADEATAVKNRSTKSFRNLIKIDGDFKLALSGTPVQNRILEIWPLVNWISKGTRLSNESKFKMMISDPITVSRMKDATEMELKAGQFAREQLQYIIDPILLRREKSILKMTAKKIDFVVWLPPTERQTALYNAMVQSPNVNAKLEEAESAVDILPLIMIFRKAAHSLTLLKKSDCSMIAQYMLNYGKSPEDLKLPKIAGIPSKYTPSSVSKAADMIFNCLQEEDEHGCKIDFIMNLLNDFFYGYDDEKLEKSKKKSTMTKMSPIPISKDFKDPSVISHTPLRPMSSSEGVKTSQPLSRHENIPSSSHSSGSSSPQYDIVDVETIDSSPAIPKTPRSTFPNSSIDQALLKEKRRFSSEYEDIPIDIHDVGDKSGFYSSARSFSDPVSMPPDRNVSTSSGFTVSGCGEIPVHKVIIFSRFLKILDKLEYQISHLYGYVRIDGSTPPETRQDLVDHFNENPTCFVFLCSTEVGGYGLTLTAADRVILTESAWNPMSEQQAIDRAYRFGQTKDVVAYRLITCGTIEERMFIYQMFKVGLSDAVLEKGSSMHRFFEKEELGVHLFKTIEDRHTCRVANLISEVCEPVCETLLQLDKEKEEEAEKDSLHSKGSGSRFSLYQHATHLLENTNALDLSLFSSIQNAREDLVQWIDMEQGEVRKEWEMEWKRRATTANSIGPELTDTRSVDLSMLSGDAISALSGSASLTSPEVRIGPSPGPIRLGRLPSYEFLSQLEHLPRNQRIELMRQRSRELARLKRKGG